MQFEVADYCQGLPTSRSVLDYSQQQLIWLVSGCEDCETLRPETLLCPTLLALRHSACRLRFSQPAPDLQKSFERPSAFSIISLEVLLTVTNPPRFLTHKTIRIDRKSSSVLCWTCWSISHTPLRISHRIFGLESANIAHDRPSRSLLSTSRPPAIRLTAPGIQITNRVCGLSLAPASCCLPLGSRTQDFPSGFRPVCSWPRLSDNFAIWRAKCNSR